jgi:hypothetical protein
MKDRTQCRTREKTLPGPYDEVAHSMYPIQPGGKELIFFGPLIITGIAAVLDIFLIGE